MKRKYHSAQSRIEMCDYNTDHRAERLNCVLSFLGLHLPLELCSLIQTFDTDFEGECVYSRVYTFRGLISLTLNNTLAVSLYNHIIYVWTLHTTQEVGILRGHKGFVRSVIELQNGNLASCSDDGIVCVWDMKTLTCVRSFEAHQDWIWIMAQLDDSRLVTASGDNTLRVWDTHSTSMIPLPHTDWVTAIAQCPDTHALYSGTKDGNIYEWRILDLKTSTSPLPPIRILHTCEGWIRSLTCLPNGDLLIGFDGDYVTLYNKQTQTRVYTVRIFNALLSQMTFLPYGVVAVPQMNNIIIFHANDGTQKCILRGHYKRIRTLQVLSNGDLLSCDNSGKVHIWK